METLLILLGAAIVVVAAIAWFANNRWKTIATAKGDQLEELERKRALLSDGGVRSRIEGDSANAAGFAAGPSIGGSAASHAVYRLEVKPKDVPKATALLEQDEKEHMPGMGVSL